MVLLDGSQSSSLRPPGDVGAASTIDEDASWGHNMSVPGREAIPEGSGEDYLRGSLDIPLSGLATCPRSGASSPDQSTNAPKLTESYTLALTKSGMAKSPTAKLSINTSSVEVSTTA
jgi:hypothetical protein